MPAEMFGKDSPSNKNSHCLSCSEQSYQVFKLPMEPVGTGAFSWCEGQPPWWWAASCFPKLPLSPQRKPIGPIINQPAEKDSDWSFFCEIWNVMLCLKCRKSSYSASKTAFKQLWTGIAVISSFRNLIIFFYKLTSIVSLHRRKLRLACLI